MTIYIQGVEQVAGGIQYTTGNYTGNAAQNRAIPHSLGVKPNRVLIVRRATNRLDIGHIGSDDVSLASITGTTPTAGGATVTAKDSTNFHVGNAGGTDPGMNATGPVYDWIAFK